jgi:hypothetical protein
LREVNTEKLWPTSPFRQYQRVSERVRLPAHAN